MEPDGSLPHSQVLATCLPWASLIQSIPPHTDSWRSALMLSAHLRLDLSSGLFPVCPSVYMKQLGSRWTDLNVFRRSFERGWCRIDQKNIELYASLSTRWLLHVSARQCHHQGATRFLLIYLVNMVGGKSHSAVVSPEQQPQEPNSLYALGRVSSQFAA
jgi:hypothetical protein